MEYSLLDRYKLKDHQKTLQAELDYLGKFLEGFSKGIEDRKFIVLPSNHNEFLNRYLTEGRFTQDIPENCKLACELFYNHLERGVDPIDFYLESRNFSIPNLRFASYDDHIMEYGFNIHHGHVGNNGAKGSLKSFDRCYEKSISGHSHSPAIFRDSFRVGTLSLFKLGYNEKGGSSWMHTNALVYPNGTCQLVHIIEGDWRL
jgi:hypothetical protein